MCASKLTCSGTCRLFFVLSTLAAPLVWACRPAQAPAAAAISADAWATVDGREIKRDEVEKAYKRTRDTAKAESNDEAMAAKLNVLNDLIAQNILLARAGQLKLEVAAGDLDTAVANAKKNVPDEAFQRELTERGLTNADMREWLRRELLAQKVIDQQVGTVAVSDQDVTDFFTRHSAEFNVPEEAYHLAQIVVTPAPDAQVTNSTGDNATTPQAAAAKMQMLMDRLKAGVQFQDLAASYSEDPETAPRGGDLGLVPVSRLRQLAQPLRDAVLNKPAGSVSVANLGAAYTLVLVVSHEEAGQRTLSTPGMRERITETLRGQKAQLRRLAYLAVIRTDAKVVNYLARRLIEPTGAPPPAAPLAAPPQGSGARSGAP
jgi:peptidyl-prolyl cis-trans isomerase SurA